MINEHKLWKVPGRRPYKTAPIAVYRSSFFQFSIFLAEIFFKINVKNLMDMLPFIFRYVCKFLSEICFITFLHNQSSSVDFYNYEPIFEDIFRNYSHNFKISRVMKSLHTTYLTRLS